MIITYFHYGLIIIKSFELVDEIPTIGCFTTLSVRRAKIG